MSARPRNRGERTGAHVTSQTLRLIEETLVLVVVATPKPRDHARLIHHSERSGIEIDADAPDLPVRIVWIER